MKQRIMNQVGLLVAVSIGITFFVASIVMFQKYNSYMRQDVRNESKYLQYAIKYIGEDYLRKEAGNITTNRVTLFKEDGTAIFDSAMDAADMENHYNRPEVKAAIKDGEGEMVRISKTFSRQTFYYAVQLEDGKILRVAKTTDSVLTMLLSSFTLMGIILIVILCLAFAIVERQTKYLIAPINKLDLEHPLDHVEYEELRPLLNRVDEQNKQIAKQVEELKAAEAVRREFSANVSHELKTPLMSISGYAEIIKNGMVRQEDVPEFAGRIYDEASRLTSLVKDIIEISKLDEKSGELPFEQVDLNELVQDIGQTLYLHAKKRGVGLKINSSHAEVYGVRHILYEMMYNLVDNAIQYNKEGGYVNVFLEQKEQIRFCVEDNGIGIAKEEQERIFERFYRVDKSHSRKTGGTGLGLSIVKHGAALHHAKIQLDSEPGKGTRIQILFTGDKLKEA